MKHLIQSLHIAAIIAALSLTSCTENERAKAFGGTMNINLPRGSKFIHATWKDNELWYATRAARPGEQPENIILQEESSFGIIEGKVIFTEN